jgi:RNA polymerase sigma-70 factor (ECF subfamily)
VTEPRNPETELLFLIRRARAGDSQAFETLATAYRDRIYRWALVRTGDLDDAEDATQEALVRLHRGLRKFSGKARFETWLYSVVRNAAAEVQRRAARSRRLNDRYAVQGALPSTTAPPRVVEGLETRRIEGLVKRFLQELPARQREAMDLVDLQGLGQAEAATRLGIRSATLRTHLFRARRAMRNRLLETVPGIEETGTE